VKGPKAEDLGSRREEQWFDDFRVVDSEWAEVSVTTSRGERVYYRVPRRTLFRKIDEQSTHGKAGVRGPVD
jgi:hypothetical protein